MSLSIRDAVSLLPGVPLFESPFFCSAWRAELGDRSFAVAKSLRCRGFAAVDIVESDFDAISERIRATLKRSYDWEAWRQTGAADMRVQDAWERSDDVRFLATNSDLKDLLARVYGREMFPFQTLNFACGSQQHLHADSVHFNTLPDGFMCGVWIALEDVTVDAGPLAYVPGSHRHRFCHNIDIGVLANQGPKDQARFHDLWAALLAHSGLTSERFLPKRGQALIWSAHLLHGGELHRDLSLSRWSQVTHYFGRDCVYLTPMLSNVGVGSMSLREPLDVGTGILVRNRHAGNLVDTNAIKTFSGLIPGRQEFDAAAYVALNPDIADAGIDPYDHYVSHGRFENRRVK